MITPRDARRVLVEWVDTELPESVERDVDINLNPGSVVTITGIRRCGKTFLLYRIAEELLRRLDKEEILYINFENELLKNFEAKDMRVIFEAHKELFDKDIKYILLDELQRIKDWELMLRRLHDQRRYRIFATGSSSELRPKELAYSLRGRTINYTLFPLSFREFLRFRKFKFDARKMLLEEYKGKVLKLLKEYLVFGGFPEIVLHDREYEKIKLISSYFDTIILRDIIEKFEIRNVRLFEEFVKYVISISSFYFSASKTERYFRSIGEKCTKPTLLDFMSYAERAFLVFSTSIFSPKMKDRRQYPQKVYTIDNGFINFVNPRFSENLGVMMENSVAIELMRRKEENPRIEIYYWKEYGRMEGREVDFVLKEGLEVSQLIQVTHASGRDEIRSREIKALLKAGEELRCRNLLCITWDYEDEEEINGRKLKFVPIWKWFLS